jgi:hypothetical protein
MEIARMSRPLNNPAGKAYQTMIPSTTPARIATVARAYFTIGAL